MEKVNALKVLVRRGKEANDQINILGDDGVPMSYHVSYWKSELIDFALLQQDGFDPVDSLCPIERQKYMADLVSDICAKDYSFSDYEKCRDWFKVLINLLRQMNYSEFNSEPFLNYQSEITKHLATNGN